MGEIVVAFKPSNLMKDWEFHPGSTGSYYEQRGYFYCTGCKKHGLPCSGSTNPCPRKVGKEPYYNLETKQTVIAPRVYITHHPQKGEWEHLKTIDDLLSSPLVKLMS